MAIREIRTIGDEVLRKECKLFCIKIAILG